ncbi:hypothetical protein BDN72DRAFT_884274 [Pluteus cervinus]|uniref:Uncharacterized protein n=1 Tax=Pluteus cervinus TaxID=181527 RepID=A0ACD2ZXH1_9AGAR|nr:hypothetical protein BDN72DRAFT_884274 [Pluteus cervinus]
MGEGEDTPVVFVGKYSISSLVRDEAPTQSTVFVSIPHEENRVTDVGAVPQALGLDLWDYALGISTGIGYSSTFTIFDVELLSILTAVPGELASTCDLNDTCQHTYTDHAELGHSKRVGYVIWFAVLVDRRVDFGDTGIDGGLKIVTKASPFDRAL